MDGFYYVVRISEHPDKCPRTSVNGFYYVVRISDHPDIGLSTSVNGVYYVVIKEKFPSP